MPDLAIEPVSAPASAPGHAPIPNTAPELAHPPVSAPNPDYTNLDIVSFSDIKKNQYIHIYFLKILYIFFEIGKS